MKFNRGNISIDIEPLIDETNKVFESRVNLIFNIKTKFGAKYTDIELEKYSKIWANIKYKGCKYNSTIYNQIRSFTKDLSIKVEEYYPP